MRQLAEYIGYLNLALYTGVALVALWQWRAGRGRAALWAALAFGALAFVVDLGHALPEEPTNDLEAVAGRVLITVLVLFPYLLYRFTTAFRPPTRRLERMLGLMTVALLVWTFTLPEIPADGGPRPAWFVAYLIAFLVHWTVLSVVVAARLWRAGRGEPNVARRRMQMLSFASAAITVALFLAVIGPEERSGLELAVTLLATLSAVTFLLGLAPPAVLRMLWRRPEQEQLQRAVAHLIGATSEQDVVEEVLPPMARIVGARAVALCAADGRVLGEHGASAQMLAAAEQNLDRPLAEGGDLLHLDVPSGSLVVWTSPYAPFFGTEELQLLRTLGALTGLALDRSRLFAREREARRALERADEIKTNFVALAAHELRTPAATIAGIVETIHERGDALPDHQRALLQNALRQQSAQMRLLVDQLLDLSRLDAEAVPIHPEPTRVGERLEQLVTSTAGDRSPDVRIDVPPELEARVDPNAFDRIVSNLVANALRYGEAPVTVTAEQRDHHFRLVVEDRGSGVPPEFVPDLFERFTRSSNARNRASGTGLGLAIARSYAHAHGGDLLYERAEPHGARFQLVLPREPPATD